MRTRYDGPLTLAGFRIPVAWKPKQAQPSQAQNTAADLEASDAAQRNNLLTGVQGQTATAQNTLNTESPTLQSVTAINPNSGTTALRQGLTNSLTSATANAYKNADAASRARYASAGLAGQPMEAGNEAAIGGQEAAALGQIPSQVEQQAAPLELQAAGLENQQANTENAIAGTGLGEMEQYNPNQPLSTEANLQGQLYNYQNQLNQANSGLWGGLAKAGLGLIQPFKL